MGRPLSRIGKKELLEIIENTERLSWSGLAKKLGINHTTILYWINKLRQHGFEIRSPNQSESNLLIEELKKEFNIKNKKVDLASGKRSNRET